MADRVADKKARRVVAKVAILTILSAHILPAQAASQPRSAPEHMDLVKTQEVSVEPACIGDCDSDGRVTVSELVRLVRIVLGLTDIACGTFTQGTSVDALVRAVNKSLRGCDTPDPTPLPPDTPTPTPTDLAPAFTVTPTRTVAIVTAGVDLFVTRVVRERCKDPRQCWALPTSAVTICVGNSGDVSSGPVSVEVNGEISNVGSVASGREACLVRLIIGAITVEVDPTNRVAEFNENNNMVSHAELDPTACDVEAFPCDRTPTPAPSDRCADCCDHCSDAACVENCAGVEPCTLVADSHGTITDSATGEPVAGAIVTVNGVSSTTDADGSYAFRSTRSEICSGLDYRFEVSVEAPGFDRFAEQFFQTPSRGDTTRNVALERDS